ncbi:MAG: cupin domain-containing protein [Alphaproteobacteria bacterium]|nr:cupin domain-containing protein [Alphaproteobacteria bacterium]
MNYASMIKTVSMTGALLLGTSFLAPAAFAGECPADKAGASPLSVETAPKNVTDNVIGSIDLGNGYNIAGKTMRLRKLVVQPGGVVPNHSHTERPANIYVVEGAITEYRSTCTVPIEHKAGDVAVESGNLSHWWRNNSKKAATLISADIVPTPMMNEGGM